MSKIAAANIIQLHVCMLVFQYDAAVFAAAAAAAAAAVAIFGCLLRVYRQLVVPSTTMLRWNARR